MPVVRPEMAQDEVAGARDEKHNHDGPNRKDQLNHVAFLSDFERHASDASKAVPGVAFEVAPGCGCSVISLEIQFPMVFTTLHPSDVFLCPGEDLGDG